MEEPLLAAALGCLLLLCWAAAAVLGRCCCDGTLLTCIGSASP